MSLSAVRHVAKPGKPSVTETVAIATVPDVRCSRQFAPSVAKTPKYRSSHVKVDQCIVAIAIEKIKLTGNISPT